ncbi:MAG: hypothetical protein ACO3N7_09730, partial [Kiritimatiellia bacterium]
MAGRFPIGKPRFPSWGLPLLAVSLTLMVHALWLVFPQPRPVPAPEPRSVRLFAYPNLDARTWSPTLFSLPSSLGFSGAIRPNSNNVRPPLQSPLSLIDSAPLDLSRIFPEPGLKYDPPREWLLPVTSAAYTDPLPFSKNTPYVWTLKVLEGVADLELNRLPPSPGDKLTLVLTGEMTFDAGGQITSLFLDPAP